ncbi:hypothetical protein [Micromonospora sp. NPDC047730]|uniref:hypothetical protein n=1 Tax=Micromonospora sp. NPDC047730 TaxID=3364253 RepID=UPI0037162969
MSWLSERAYEPVVLDQLRVGIRSDLGAFAADRLEIRRRLDEMVYDLTTYVLARQLPDERVTERRREQIERRHGSPPGGTTSRPPTGVGGGCGGAAGRSGSSSTPTRSKPSPWST